MCRLVNKLQVGFRIPPSKTHRCKRLSSEISILLVLAEVGVLGVLPQNEAVCI